MLAMQFTVFSALPMLPSAQSMFPAQGQAQARAQVLSASPLQARSRDGTLTRIMCFTVSCAADGAITTFDVPDAGTAPGQGAAAPPTSIRQRRSRDAT